MRYRFNAVQQKVIAVVGFYSTPSRQWGIGLPFEDFGMVSGCRAYSDAQWDTLASAASEVLTWREADTASRVT